MSAVVLPEELPGTSGAATDTRRLRTLQTVGMICGLTAGAWLGAAEAPTKLVNSGLSPVVVSLATA